MAAARAHALVLSTLILCASRTALSLPAFDTDEVLGNNFTIDLRGAYRESELGDRETLGFILLSVPLDRLSIGEARKAGASGAARPFQRAQSLAQSSEPPATVPQVEASAKSAPEQEPPPAEPSSELRPLVTPALARAVVKAALGASGKGPARARFDSLEGRARTSALLPELRLRAARTTDESLRLTPTADDPYRYTQAGAAALTFEARATWKLDRLAFADEELAIERLRGERARADAALTERVLSALFKWQRATLKSADPSLDPEQRLLHAVEAAEAEVVLDVLTAGWFARMVEVKKTVSRRATASRGSAAKRRPPPSARAETGKSARSGVDDRRNARRDP